MTYIKLEDVQKQIIEICSCWNPIIEKEILQSINSLPSINPEAMIEEMIEKVLKSNDPYELELPDYRNNPTASLQELLQRFKS